MKRNTAQIIPQYHGDFTEFWTNGLGADAASVGKGRIAKESLIQAEILWSILRPGKSSTEKFKQAWEDNLLSAEHTWGAQIQSHCCATSRENKSNVFRERLAGKQKN